MNEDQSALAAELGYTFHPVRLQWFRNYESQYSVIPDVLKDSVPYDQNALAGYIDRNRIDSSFTKMEINYNSLIGWMVKVRYRKSATDPSKEWARITQSSGATSFPVGHDLVGVLEQVALVIFKYHQGLAKRRKDSAESTSVIAGWLPSEMTKVKVETTATTVNNTETIPTPKKAAPAKKATAAKKAAPAKKKVSTAGNW